ncbi:unnamed protein product [Cercospora beticola]|nr:unnamed protein product [Cercospora beticola]
MQHRDEKARGRKGSMAWQRQRSAMAQSVPADCERDVQALDTTHARPLTLPSTSWSVPSSPSLLSHPTRRPACPKQSLNGNMSTTTRLHSPETTTAFAANGHGNDHRSQYFAPSAALRVRVAATPLLSTPPPLARPGELSSFALRQLTAVIYCGCYHWSTG